LKTKWAIRDGQSRDKNSVKYPDKIITGCHFDVLSAYYKYNYTSCYSAKRSATNVCLIFQNDLKKKLK